MISVIIVCLIFQPLLREALEKNPDMSATEAVDTIDKCLRVLYYRDCRTLNKVSCLHITQIYSSKA